MQRVVGILVGVLILFWILDSPTTAAGTVTAILDALGDGARQVTVFLRTLL